MADLATHCRLSDHAQNSGSFLLTENMPNHSRHHQHHQHHLHSSKETIRPQVTPEVSLDPSSKFPPVSKSGGKVRARPARSVRKPARYTDYFRSSVQNQEEAWSDEEAWQSPDPKAEEDARIERSMGVIRKNAASRSSDGGTKYHCDVYVLPLRVRGLLT
jgi:hypothetical protein